MRVICFFVSPRHFCEAVLYIHTYFLRSKVNKYTISHNGNLMQAIYPYELYKTICKQFLLLKSAFIHIYRFIVLFLAQITFLSSDFIYMR